MSLYPKKSRKASQVGNHQREKRRKRRTMATILLRRGSAKTSKRTLMRTSLRKRSWAKVDHKR